MDLHWFFFALISPFLWAFSNILDSAIRRKFIRNDYTMTWLLTMLRLPIVVILVAIYGFEFPGWAGGWMLLAGMLWTVVFVPYLRALEFEETSRVALFLESIPIFTLILGYLVLDESLSVQQVLAFVLILLGGGLAAIKSSKNKWHFSRAFWLIMFACFFWATSDVLFKLFSYDFSSFISAFTMFLAGSFLTGVLALIFAPIRRRIFAFEIRSIPLRGWLLECASLLVGVAGSCSFAYALTIGKIALTSVLIQTQPFFVFILTLVLGKFWHTIDKEDTSKMALVFKGLSLLVISGGLLCLYLV